MNQEKATLSVENLKTYFFTKAGIVKAVDDVSFFVNQGEVMGLVGESGCGKSVTGYSILGLLDPPGQVVGGRILFHGEDLTKKSDKQMRQVRGSKLAMIFQDPLMTLNPVFRIDTQMMETIQAHKKNVSREEAWRKSREALIRVGIASPEARLKSYPYQFSGGMRQRVAIAIAMLNNPELIIADEPTTALDVTIQSQILSEVQKLCRELRTSLIWITHDLTVVAGLADKISVMYAGRIVEQGMVDDVLNRPLHPYTKGLIGSVPRRNRKGAALFQIPGSPPSLLNLIKGCAFRVRCLEADEMCLNEPAVTFLEHGRSVRCFHHYGK